MAGTSDADKSLSPTTALIGSSFEMMLSRTYVCATGLNEAQAWWARRNCHCFRHTNCWSARALNPRHAWRARAYLRRRVLE